MDNFDNLKEIAENYDKNLLSNDERFNNCVQILSRNDFTYIFYDNAFAVKYNDWYFVFTEHYGTHIFHKDDVRVKMLKVSEIKEFA